MVEYSPLRGFSDARAVQRLTLQDVKLGGFPHPKEIANPYSPRLVWRQMKKLEAHPENYEGAFLDNWLAGYMKTAEWTIRDEFPFASEDARRRLLTLEEAGITTDPEKKLGIFGLVVSNRLDEDSRADIIEHFLERASERALSMGKLAVAVIPHDHDPVLEFLGEDGYSPTGRVGEASGAPGLLQELYIKPLDS